MNYQEEKLAEYLDPAGGERGKPSEPTKRMVESFHVTVGFTIDRLDKILESLKFSIVTPDQETQVLGWIFWFPNNPPDVNDKLILDISVEQLEIVITNTGSELNRSPLLAFGSSQNITLAPKIFYQPKEINGSPLDSSYATAFDETLPRFVADNEIPVSALEEYENWTDFAFLPTSELKNMKAMLSGNTIYSDVFFSGARINYATSHNPLMRNEQLTLPNKHTGEVLAPESHLPFTLKAEYYVASDDNTRAWLRSPVAEGSQLPPPVPPLSGSGNRLQPQVNDDSAEESREREEEPATPTSEAFMPGTYIIPPCPPVWIYPPQVAKEVQSIYPDIGTDALMMLTTRVYTSLHKPDQEPRVNSISLPQLSLEQVLPPPAIIPPVPRKNFWERLLDFWRALIAIFVPSVNSSNR